MCSIDQQLYSHTDAATNGGEGEGDYTNSSPF